jgi:hypothetical protein
VIFFIPQLAHLLPQTCELCKKSDRDTEMLLCDGCDEGS